VHNSIPEYVLSLLKRQNIYIKKGEGKRKAPRVSSNKRGSQYFERRKTL
jgi:hypothetical protein